MNGIRILQAPGARFRLRFGRIEWAHERGITIEAEGRVYLMDGASIAAFLVHAAESGAAWREIVGCDRCRVICFEGCLCRCSGHARAVHPLPRHSSIASVARLKSFLSEVEEKAS